MPTLEEIKQQKKEKEKKIPFVKKEYRVWNFNENELKNPPTEIKNKKTTKRQQLDNKKTTVRQQLDNKKTTVRQQLDNKKTTVRQQLDNNLDNKKTYEIPILTESIRQLCGLQEKAFFYILERCNTNGELTTGEIITKELANFIGCGYRSLKTTFERLVSKNLLLRLYGKRSGKGFVRFNITKEHKISGARVEHEKCIANSNFKNYLSLVRQQLDNNLDNKATTSSSSNFKITTTTPNNKLEEIDLLPLQKTGLNENHLAQLIKTISGRVIQDSINHFAYDLEHNSKEKEIKKTPLDYFMGIMKRNGCYNAPDNYESPQDKAIREWVEKEEKQKKLREEQRMKVFNLAFDKWLDSLTEEEARKIFRNENPHSRIPFKGKGEGGFSQSILRNYYREKIWVNERKELGLDGFWDHFNDNETTKMDD